MSTKQLKRKNACGVQDRYFIERLLGFCNDHLGGGPLDGVSKTNFTSQEWRLLDTRRLFESGRLLDHLR